MKDFDTIGAISTSIGEGGIAIVRISGDKAKDVVEKIFQAKNGQSIKDMKSYTMKYGYIIDENNNHIDEVIVSFMKGPRSFTAEDTIEINCHGGVVATNKVLEQVIKQGVRIAEPGEFTKRAFLNGRLDLTQAEAVIDLIKAKTDKSFEASLGQLEGTLSRKIKEIRNILLEMIAHIEVSIDFPDEDVEEMTYDDLKKNGNIVKEEIEKLLLTADRGKILRDGLNTVILGKPNVGKSSLLNTILGENRAIVTDIPGTTRDIIEEYVNIDGIPLKIIDTAGIRNTEDLVEQIGVDKAKETVEKADLIIAVFDASRELSEEDYQIIKLIKGKKSIILLNKTDLMPKYDMDHLKSLLDNKEIITTSITSGIGIDSLEDSIKSLFFAGDIEIKSDAIITNMRHKNQLIRALENIVQGIEDLNENVPIDCIEVDLKNCWENLGEISGDTIGEDILDKIFSEFCIGK